MSPRDHYPVMMRCCFPEASAVLLLLLATLGSVWGADYEELHSATCATELDESGCTAAAGAVSSDGTMSLMPADAAPGAPAGCYRWQPSAVTDPCACWLGGEHALNADIWPNTACTYKGDSPTAPCNMCGCRVHASLGHACFTVGVCTSWAGGSAGSSSAFPGTSWRTCDPEVDTPSAECAAYTPGKVYFSPGAYSLGAGSQWETSGPVELYDFMDTAGTRSNGFAHDYTYQRVSPSTGSIVYLAHDTATSGTAQYDTGGDPSWTGTWTLSGSSVAKRHAQLTLTASWGTEHFHSLSALTALAGASAPAAGAACTSSRQCICAQKSSASVVTVDASLLDASREQHDADAGTFTALTGSTPLTAGFASVQTLTAAGQWFELEDAKGAVGALSYGQQFGFGLVSEEVVQAEGAAGYLAAVAMLPKFHAYNDGVSLWQPGQAAEHSPDGKGCAGITTDLSAAEQRALWSAGYSDLRVGWSAETDKLEIQWYLPQAAIDASLALVPSGMGHYTIYRCHGRPPPTSG